jgi:AcrR family transcriptional regulator
MLGKMSESRKRRKAPYHHGDLERALVQAAVEMIRADGVASLTLRSVGAKVGVSRTALYRHFEDKAALLARVAAEGFRLLYDTMARAIANSSDDQDDVLQVMGAAYVRFALANQSHYETMFGGALSDWERYPNLMRDAHAAFDQLVEVVRGEQRRGRIGPGDPVNRAEIIWSLVHGISTLAAARHLPFTAATVEELAVLGSRFLQRGMS